MCPLVHRPLVDVVLARLVEPPRLIQVIVGPRQVGKTTVARQVLARWDGPTHYGTADGVLPPTAEWIRAEWSRLRHAARDARGKPALLVLDEIQKIESWSDVVKAEWDSDRIEGRDVAVLLLGSSVLLLSRGMSESLTGRFFLNRCLHWSYAECAAAFGWTLDDWLFYGGYPGAAALTGDPAAWRAYVTDSLIETVLARDVLALHTIAKPALLRHLFQLAARFPAEVLSYNKMLGQLQDAGNTTTLASYLRVLETAFLVSGLERYSRGHARSRGSSPKLVLWNNALVTAPGLRELDEVRADRASWGRLVENAVGGHLLNHLQSLAYDVSYWRERSHEVDYIVRTTQATWAVEVKSGRDRGAPGLAAFTKKYPEARPLIVGSGGIPLEEFFRSDPVDVFRA